VRVTGNTVRYAFVGLSADQTQGARATDDRFRDVFGGIWVSDESLPILGDDRQSMDNQLRRNAIPASPSLDASCMDDTTGAGTLGTANTWTGNTAPADSSQPLGICGPGELIGPPQDDGDGPRSDPRPFALMVRRRIPYHR